MPSLISRYINKITMIHDNNILEINEYKEISKYYNKILLPYTFSDAYNKLSFLQCNIIFLLPSLNIYDIGVRMYIHLLSNNYIISIKTLNLIILI